jgi:uncharacterized protein (TIGR00251 family)
MSWYYWDNSVLILNLHLQPNASKDGWVGLHGDRLKLRISAPPIDGKANQHLIAWLAKEFGVSKTACTLLCGDSGRQKKVAIQTPQRFPLLPEGLEFNTQ